MTTFRGSFEELRRLADENKGTVTAVTAILASAVAAWTWFSKVSDLAKKELDAHLLPAGTAHATDGLVFVVTFLAVCSVLLLIAFVAILVVDVRQRTVRNPRTALLEAALAKLTENTQRIVNQSYPAKSSSPYAFDKTTITVVYSANGDMQYQREDHVRAFSGPMNYWILGIRGEADSTPVEFVEQLGFTVEDPGDPKTSVVYQVFNNSPIEKKIAIWHLPHVEPTEPDPRVVKTTFNWPGFAKKFLRTNEEVWAWEMKSSRQVGTFEFFLYCDAALGTVECALIGTHPPDWSLREVQAAGRKGWHYSVQNSPANGFSHELRFRRKS